MTTPLDARGRENGNLAARDEGGRKKPQSNAAIGASAAGIRAAYARAINPRIQANESWSWRMSTPGVLAHAVKTYGWSFVPNNVLPPMIANVTVGAVLYTSYLQALGAIYEPPSHSIRRVCSPAPLASTFSAGFVAGTFQSVVAAPLDALQVRFQTTAMLEGQYKSMWDYARHKLHTIGIRGVFAGWGLSFVKDSFGYGIFFAMFEFIKSQAYYAFVTRYYGRQEPVFTFHRYRSTIRDGEDGNPTIRPHYALEPSFVLFAGVMASIAQQGIQHPLGLVQEVYYGRLESLDYQAKLEPSHNRMLRLYYRAYKKTYGQCLVQAKRAGGWKRWLYKGFLVHTLRQVPSTSAGLIVFEIVRRKYGQAEDAISIEKDGYDILLP
ncbi:mitochondrial carrier domain-containing protein [Cryomyces antarcticus]